MASAMLLGNRAARVWLFDFDNTLAALEREVDWAASRCELERFLRAEGVDEDLFREYPSRNLPLYNALLLRRMYRAKGNGDASTGNNTELLERASAIIEAYELRGVVHAAPLPGATAILRALAAANNVVAIVTSNSSRTVGCWLKQHQLLDAVNEIVGRDSILPLKPAPDMILSALARCHGKAADAVLVGDSEADVGAARRAGVNFFGIAGGEPARARLGEFGAGEIFASPEELAAHVRADAVASAPAAFALASRRRV
jgi:HAD superfamily hydrolase (TIGR01509 family)